MIDKKLFEVIFKRLRSAFVPSLFITIALFLAGIVWILIMPGSGRDAETARGYMFMFYLMASAQAGPIILLILTAVFYVVRAAIDTFKNT